MRAADGRYDLRNEIRWRRNVKLDLRMDARRPRSQLPSS